MDEFRDENGHIRMLGRKLPTTETLMKRAGKMSFSRYLESIGQTLIPRSQWKSFGRRKSGLFGKQFLLNQMQHGSCCGYSGAGALMVLRALRGMSFERLSGSYLYAHINNNRDQGGIITDVMGVLAQFGTCLDSTMDANTIFMSQIPAGAKEEALRFREEGDVTIGTFDEMGTVIQMDGIWQGPIMVGNSFESYSSDGVVGFDRGPGNHSIYGLDVEQLSNGEWVLTCRNSWAEWGPWSDGYFLVSERSIAGCAAGDDAFAHFAAKLDPSDPNNPPQVTE